MTNDNYLGALIAIETFKISCNRSEKSKAVYIEMPNLVHI